MKKKFYPDYLIEILFVALLTFELILVLTFLFPPTIGREIDFMATYQPRPEWYFLWLFWLVRVFSSDLLFLAGVLIPFLIISFLLMIPWIESKIGWRLTAMIAFAIFLVFLYATVTEIITQ